MKRQREKKKGGPREGDDDEGLFFSLSFFFTLTCQVASTTKKRKKTLKKKETLALFRVLFPSLSCVQTRSLPSPADGPAGLGVFVARQLWWLRGDEKPPLFRICWIFFFEGRGMRKKEEEGKTSHPPSRGAQFRDVSGLSSTSGMSRMTNQECRATRLTRKRRAQRTTTRMFVPSFFCRRDLVFCRRRRQRRRRRRRHLWTTTFFSPLPPTHHAVYAAAPAAPATASCLLVRTGGIARWR